LSGIYSFDPLEDMRWTRFLERRADASVFHTTGWLKALRQTYGYEPVAYTSSPPGEELRDGLLFCRINTWLSGKRLVSLPFSDHAAVLVDDQEVLHQIFSLLWEQARSKTWKYLEIRPVVPVAWVPPGLRKTATFYWHKLALEKPLDSIFRSFHKSCVQRRIGRAEREGLTYSEGRTEELIQQFYRLLLLTHRRHGIPPQPISWFRNLVDCLRENMTVRVASKDGRAVASMITLNHRDSMVYKYGCSDERYHNWGAVAFLMWRAVQDAKGREFEELDMGRTDCDNTGLVNFKNNWGATQSMLVYWGYPERLRPNPNRWDLRTARTVVARLPTAVLPVIGQLLYRHMG
jgi:CelD/BcsL family acetyltransferase involved in cellulose biosynthesis